MKTRNDGCQREAHPQARNIGIYAKPMSAESGQKVGLTTSRVSGKSVLAWDRPRWLLPLSPAEMGSPPFQFICISSFYIHLK